MPPSSDLLALLDTARRHEAAHRHAAAAMHAIALAPSLPTLHANAGDLLYRLHRLDEAAVALQRALALQPDAPRILNKLGCVRRAEGRYAEAEAHFRAAAAAAPAIGAAKINLGTLLLHLQQHEAGVAILTEALALPALGSEEREEAEGALTIVHWQRRLRPAIEDALCRTSPMPIALALAETPPELLHEDTERLQQFERMAARQDPRSTLVDLFPRFAPDGVGAGDWPAIEAHFAFHGPENRAAICATIATVANTGSAAAGATPDELDVLLYAQAVRDAAIVPLPEGGGIAAEAWIRF